MILHKAMRCVAALSLAAGVAGAASAQALDFLNTEANRIMMNGDDWSGLANELAGLELLPDSKFQILQIGDSHIQAGHIPAVVRRTLQGIYGNGGRGLVAALKLVGTNEPGDYRLTADATPSASCRLLNKKWPVTMGVTGVSAMFAKPEREITVSVVPECGGFCSVTLLHAKGGGYLPATVNGQAVAGEHVTPYATCYALDGVADSVIVSTSVESPIFGAYLLNPGPGVVVNAIGNNGACYSDYLCVPDFAEQTKIFNPSLIILSMGTNEAFSSMTVDSICSSIDSLVTMLRQAHPGAKFLLTTPMECHKKTGGGKNRRFVVNARVKEVRDLILRYGEENGVPVWDLYEVAGGDGAANQWIVNGLMNKRDHVHCLLPGYELQGSLLVDALIECFERQ